MCARRRTWAIRLCSNPSAFSVSTIPLKPMQTIRILALLFALAGFVRAALPTLDTQPASSTNCPGTPVTFTVATSSDSSTNFQWYFNETNVIVDATNTSYTIASVIAGHAGGY